jgi:hypothetical protein
MNRRDFLVKLGLATAVMPILVKGDFAASAPTGKQNIGFVTSERINKICQRLAKELEESQPLPFRIRTQMK